MNGGKCSAGCIPIVLAKHLAAGQVLYPLKFLGFEVVLLESWGDLPDKLLWLAEEVAHNLQVWKYNKYAIKLLAMQVPFLKSFPTFMQSGS